MSAAGHLPLGGSLLWAGYHRLGSGDGKLLADPRALGTDS